MNTEQSNAAVMRELGEVKGQLTVLMQVMQSNTTATNRRIDDMRDAVAGRLDSHEKRISTLEVNERGTAVKAGMSGMVGAAIVSAAIKAITSISG